MSTVRYFRHDDVGAPTLTGEVGSLTNLLRKCLVGTAGVAYGSKASAGWTEQFVGAEANMAVFKNVEGEGGSGCCVLVNDNAPGAAGAREARVAVYSDMTAIGAGSHGTDAYIFRKSSTSNNVGRSWLVVADGLTAWLYVYQTGDSASTQATQASFAGFGDYSSLSAGAFRYFALGRTAENQSLGGSIPALDASATSYTGTGNRGISVFPQSGLGGPIFAAVCMPVYSASSTAIGGQFAPAGPHSITGDYFFEVAPRIRSVTSFEILGRLRGLALPYQSISFSTAGVAFSLDPASVVVAASRGNASSVNDCGFLKIDTLGPW